MEEVVITGMGCVSALGNSPELLWQNLLQSKSGVVRVQRFDPSAFASQVAAEVLEFDDSEYFSNRDKNRYSRYIRYGVYAAMQALKNAGVNPQEEDPFRSAVIFTSGIGGVTQYYETSNALSARGPSRVSPFFIPMTIVNMAAGEVANRTGWMGPCYSVVSACASSNHAIASAFDQIRLGRADIVVTGGADETVIPLTVAGFSAMRAVSRRNDSPDTASRPFDIDRDGFVIGEGCGALVLESLSHAKARGAKILARLVGCGMSADAHHISAPREDGKGVLLAMQSGLKEAGIFASDINYINTHGTSTPLGDVAECRAIEQLFGDVQKTGDRLKVNSSKSMIGHCLGAAGSLEAIVCVQSILDQKLHGTRNVFNLDSQIHLDVCANGACDHKIDYAMSNSFGFGGQNCVLVFGRY